MSPAPERMTPAHRRAWTQQEGLAALSVLRAGVCGWRRRGSALGEGPCWVRRGHILQGLSWTPRGKCSPRHWNNKIGFRGRLCSC